MRPGDLVGAIANEAGLEGRQIGPIRIADHYSVVGVPEREADRVIGVMNGTTIRGKSTKVRRFTELSFVDRPASRLVSNGFAVSLPWLCGRVTSTNVVQE